jgi:MFS family permease
MYCFVFILGVGMGHLNLASEVSVTLGFDKHRSLAVAIASMGGGFGTFVLPFLTTFCLEQYGWRGTFLILSGVMLQGVVAGALLNYDNISTAPACAIYISQLI